MLEKIKVIFGLQGKTDENKEIEEKFGSITVGEVEWRYDGDSLVEGIEVFDNEGNAIPDGEYIYEDKTITVADGKVASIVEKEEEVEPEQPVENAEETEPAVEEPQAEPEVSTEEENKLEEMLNDFITRIMTLEEKVRVLEEKLSDTEEVAEQFSKAQPSDEPFFAGSKEETKEEKLSAYDKLKKLKELRNNK